MNLPLHIWHLVVRQPQRTITAAAGVAIAAALLMSVVLFGAASATTVTQRALATLPVDAQALLAPGTDRAAATAILKGDGAIASTVPFDLIHFDSASTSTAGAATQTSSGVIAGVDAGFQQATGLFVISSGTTRAGDITVSRDFATNLGLTPGDTITFALPGGSTADLKISGIVDATGADLLLGPTDAAHRAAGVNPPVNVALTDRPTLERLATTIPAGALAADPSASGAGPAGIATPVAAPEPAVLHEVLLRYDHARLPGSPTDAQTWLDTVRRRIEWQAGGSVTVVDDASASLEPVAKDLAWGQVLFVFLALPGVALALALSRFSAESSAEATRRHAALLRARGASHQMLVVLFLSVAAAIALAGATIGALGGTLLSFIVFGAELSAADPFTTIVIGAASTILATTSLATLAAALPLREQIRGEVATGRQELGRLRAPLWSRLYLDVVALVAAGLVFWLTGVSGVQPVLNAEGDPTVTLALTSFVAPFLFWVGGSLLLLRLVGHGITHGARLSNSLRRILGPGGELAAHSLAMRSTAAARAIVLLALAVSFATSTLIFDATYRQQQRVDAELTLGADLKAVSATPVDASAADTVAGPGVASVSPFVDRVVYVGSEAQDLLAIDAASLPATAPLSDTFFQGTTAAAAMQALIDQPDAIFVSAETAKDYSIVPGDRLRVRVPDPHGQLREVDFRMVGVVLEFPTAPSDAFLVANLGYVSQRTDDPRISFVLARASGDPGDSLGLRLGSSWTVTDLGSTVTRLANSVTSVDLAALVALDVGFAVSIASVGVALFLLAGLAERRRELASLAAIGADPGHLRAAVAGETLVVGLTGVVSGLVTGGLVGVTLLAILAGIFDPPADLPVIPVAAMGLVVVAVAAGLGAGLIVAGRATARIDVLAVLRER